MDVADLCDGFEPAIITTRKMPAPEKLVDVVRVAAGPGKQVVVRIAENVFERLGWVDGSMVLVMKGKGALEGKVRFRPVDGDDEAAQVRICRLPRNRAWTVKFSASQIGADVEFDIFSAPFEVSDGSLTIDLSSIIGGAHA